MFLCGCLFDDGVMPNGAEVQQQSLHCVPKLLGARVSQAGISLVDRGNISARYAYDPG